jgi:hypothetical protein
MSTFPGSPRLQKGALIAMDSFNLGASTVVFQYNPETLTRTISPQAAGEGADKGEVLRLKGPPQETMKLEIEIDATDQLEQAKAPATSMGIYPTLASLEMMLYPKSTVVIANEVLLNLGIIEVIPAEAPLAVLVWGSKRVVPVRLTDLSITEEAFDPNLNPIRAKASLGLRVLTYEDLGLLSPGGALFMVHQRAKELMATMGSAGPIPTLPKIF